MRLHVGCAMWRHPAWLGRFISRAVPARARLRSCATWCNAVEGNSTFYAIPHRSTVAAWAQQTAPDFRFVLKLPKVITHTLRLRHFEDSLREFLDVIEPLGPRVHALWVQLPGTFGPDELSLLATFLHRLPKEYRYAVEVRHRAFFDHPRATSLLERVLDSVAAEWVPFDTTAFFRHPPTSEAERGVLGAEAAATAAVARADRPAHRSVSGPRRSDPDGGRLAPMGRHHCPVAAGGAFADGVHPHAGQHGRADVGATLPRRGRRTGARADAAADILGRGRGAHAVLTPQTLDRTCEVRGPAYWAPTDASSPPLGRWIHPNKIKAPLRGP